VTEREALSFCRMCPGACGMRLSLDETGRLTGLRAQQDHPMTSGYACFKGLQSAEFHNSGARLLHPLKRRPDGSFERIGLDQALDEIAGSLGAIIDRDGADAVACFLGTAGYMNASASAMLPHWMRAIGSTSYFSSLTIDQSAKLVTQGRLGAWHAGRQSWDSADVWMLVGANPMVSLSSAAGLPPYNGQKKLRDSKARGMKFIVVDPRRTETAHFADIHLQPYPGTDPTVMAGLLRIILDEGWEDRAFCDRHVGGLDRLIRALRPFDAGFVASRTGVPADRLRAAAAMFAGTPKRGCTGTGTGACMSANSNFADHMVELLNVICGRYLREGERLPNPGVTDPYVPKRAEVVPPSRWWEKGRRSRVRGVGTFPGLMSTELASGIMADEMLLPGPGQIRALIVEGGNPAAAIPDQEKVVRAFRGLDLLVAIDPFMSATARLAQYVIPPKLQYERADLPMLYGLGRRFPVPFMQYTPEIAAVPHGAEIVDDWYVYWALAKRLGLKLEFCGTFLDMAVPPTTEELIRTLLKDGKVPFDEIREHPSGKIFDLTPQYVEAARPGDTARFDVIPDDIAEDLRRAAEAPPAGAPFASNGRGFDYIMTSRRMRDAMNSVHDEAPAIRARHRSNPLYMTPDDMGELGIVDGDRVEILSDHGRITARVEADPALRSRVVQMSHCWGGLPGDGEERGANTNLLISTDRDCEVINAMPRQSGIPVNINAITA
jgi:anaerobic selenocysteine-containing dehydrogenase